MAVHKSNKNIYAQLINDVRDKVEIGVSSLDKEIREQEFDSPKQRAREVGKKLAQQALEKDIKAVVLDRKNFKYHGLIKELADGAREGGLDF
ncbi:MAG: 50S ribosomal protein L18 [Elusimicrobiota bacterium]